ncbi:MAG TPA: hypothetical protein VMS64_24555 [Candidatus Methylomirabilis sp.]|nr:hypothetical protein [Candidatus Methylomirabilis sp.]
MTTRRQWTIAVGIALTMTACATATQNTEALLSQAGFRQLPADTPQKVSHLQTLPERKLIGRTYQGKKYYVYSDPEGCKCLYIGNPEQYKIYQGLVQQLQTPASHTGGVEEAREWEIENSGLQ